MKSKNRRWHTKIVLYATIVCISVFLLGYHSSVGNENAGAFSEVWAESGVKQPLAPAPLLEKGHPVDWWFVFKFNAASFPGCGENAQRDCLFGGTVQDYQGRYSQQFVYASSENPSLQRGSGCVGDTLKDPVGPHSIRYITMLTTMSYGTTNFMTIPASKDAQRAVAPPGDIQKVFSPGTRMVQDLSCRSRHLPGQLLEVAHPHARQTAIP